ncbi:GGDEF domain-containing protein [Bradyrhizobium sp. KBS0727]|nr:GGDEF domain-containing protein [Bradyrhizobium sp. KBS0725]QDW44028.1 GGDEF domain-containing protein [Bradyrhizobium sp. KBS0727]
MFISDKDHSRPALISDAVYAEIIATLYGTLVPIVLTGFGLAIVGTIAARQTGDTLTALLTAFGVVFSLMRTLDVFAYRRRVVGTPLARAEGVIWEWRYASGSVIMALIIGLFAARSLMLEDAICSVMAIGVGFGFGAGVVSRLSLRPITAIMDLGMIGFPVIVTAFLQRLDAPHVGLGLLMTIFMIGSFEMVRLSYKSTLNQMTLKQQFEQLSRTDPMTGLLNRSVLAIDLARIVAERGNRRVVVHAIDLDHFKAANDRFGHPVGDVLLRQVAARLQSVAGQGDLIVRMGGDEFILVQRSVSSRGEAERMVRRIFEEVSAPYCIEGHDIVIGASIGVAMSPEDGGSVEALLSRSDKALYQAKTQRGGSVFAQDVAVATTASSGEVPVQQRAA